MRRFFFHVESDDLKVPDLVGAELRDIATVRAYAETQLTEIWAQRILTGQPPLTGWLEVVDQEERAVMRLPL